MYRNRFMLTKIFGAPASKTYRKKSRDLERTRHAANAIATVHTPYLTPHSPVKPPHILHPTYPTPHISYTPHILHPTLHTSSLMPHAPHLTPLFFSPNAFSLGSDHRTRASVPLVDSLLPHHREDRIAEAAL